MRDPQKNRMLLICNETAKRKWVWVFLWAALLPPVLLPAPADQQQPGLKMSRVQLTASAFVLISMTTPASISWLRLNSFTKRSIHIHVPSCATARNSLGNKITTWPVLYTDIAHRRFCWMSDSSRSTVFFLVIIYGTIYHHLMELIKTPSQKNPFQPLTHS